MMYRSYKRQGIGQAPTVHEGVAVRQMEAKYAKYRPLRGEMKKLLDVKYCVDRAFSGAEDKGRKTLLLVNERD